MTVDVDEAQAEDEAVASTTAFQVSSAISSLGVMGDRRRRRGMMSLRAGVRSDERSSCDARSHGSVLTLEIADHGSAIFSVIEVRSGELHDRSRDERSRDRGSPAATLMRCQLENVPRRDPVHFDATLGYHVEWTDSRRFPAGLRPRRRLRRIRGGSSGRSSVDEEVTILAPG